VATIGFDEKFVIRAILRNLKELEKIYLVTARPIEEKVAKAIDQVKQFVNVALLAPGFKVIVEVVDVEIEDFPGAVSQIRKKCFSEPDNYVVSLGGGMRAVVLATLAAFLVSGARGEIEVELENFRGVIKFKPELFKITSLGDYEKSVISSLTKHGRATYKELLEDTGLSRATLFRVLKSLKLKGLIEVHRENKTSYYTLTDVGRIYT
jgi:CRISPR-associated protein Csa3